MKNPLKMLSDWLKSTSEDADPDQAFLLEHRGDQAANQGNARQALKFYLEALEHLPERIELIDKMLAQHEALKEDWQEEDFELNLTLTMRKQEILDPTFKRIHARALPESDEIKVLIRDLLKSSTSDEETVIVEKIAAYDQLAIYPLLDFILSLKSESHDEKPQSSN